MFVWAVRSILAAFESILPEVNSLFKDGLEVYGTPGEEKFIAHAYAVCKSVSIDYGIMEKADNVYVLPSDFGWSDLGTWGSLHENRLKDEHNNAVSGKNVMLYNSSDCVVHIPDEKLVVIQGLEGYIVVEDENIMLICKKEDEQQIKQIVIDVKLRKGDRYI